jgi:DNA-nicking Smr family endonuclease
MKNITVDLHGYTAKAALARLAEIIDGAPENTRTITVIHGNIHGTVLRDAVRKNLRNQRIWDKVPSFKDDGVTVIYLKNDRR